MVDYKYPGHYGMYSSAGSNFDATDGVEKFDGVPYSNLDFNDYFAASRGPCHGNIQSSYYDNNPWGVRQCRLDGLLDLNHDKDYVRQQISGYFNRLIDIGVAGIRIDAAKHMWPENLDAILTMVKNLNKTIYGDSKYF